MKKIRFIFIVVFLISVSSYYRPVLAQEKTSEEKQKELELREEIEAQKRAIAEQKKAQEETVRAFKDQQIVMEEAMKNAQEQVQAVSKYRDIARGFRGNGAYQISEPFIFTPGIESFYGHSFGVDMERTTWDFTKSIKENSFSNQYSFEVESAAKNVVMTVNGDCKAGDIRIRIILPNGKTYSDIVIDEFGNLNWRKSFTVSEEENKDKVGEWKFKVDANKATGIFKISLQVY